MTYSERSEQTPCPNCGILRRHSGNLEGCGEGYGKPGCFLTEEVNEPAAGLGAVRDGMDASLIGDEETTVRLRPPGPMAGSLTSSDAVQPVTGAGKRAAEPSRPTTTAASGRTEKVAP